MMKKAREFVSRIHLIVSRRVLIFLVAAILLPTVFWISGSSIVQLDHAANVKTPHGLDFQIMKQQEKCVFVILCGTGDVNTVSEMKPVIISAVLLSSCPLHFVLIADENSAERAHSFFKNEMNVSRVSLSVDIWTIPIQKIEKWAWHLGIGLPMGLEKKGPWLLAKLFVPFMLNQFDRIIVLDSDMVFLEDPANLWSNFDDGKSWIFKLPMKDLTTASRICSCVVLIKVKMVLQRGVYPKLVRSALLKIGEPWYDPVARIYRPKHADQGVYFALRKAYPNLFASLDRRYNVDHCHFYYGVFDSGSDLNVRQKVSILHKNCGTSALHMEHADHFFRFFKHYQPDWFRNDNAEMTFKTEVNSHIMNEIS